MPRPIVSRREFVTSGCALAGATLFGTVGCGADDIVAPVAATGDRRPRGGDDAAGDLLEPRVIASVGGVLTATITASTNPAVVGGRHAKEPVTYDGTFPGPTLWVRPGDTIDLTFVNKIVFDQAGTKPGYGRPPRAANMANLHYHGLHVSPLGSADNMLIMVPARGTEHYFFQVPLDHPAGLFWYHEHVHGLVTNHVSRGAAGMLYVANAHTDLVARLGIRRRLMLLQQAYFDTDRETLISDDGERDDPDLALSLINGQYMPEVRMRPGEVQVWSLCNGSTSAFYQLRAAGHTFDVIAVDGVPVAAAGRRETDRLVLSSGNRVEVVVRASAQPGRYAMSYDAYDQGVDTWPQKTVATIVVDGPAWVGPAHPGVDTTSSPEDLSAVDVPSARRRTIVLGMNSEIPEGEFGRFTMNGHAWDPAYSEWTSALGTVEEWLILNETEQEHPFHVHVNPFQVTRVNGAAVPFAGHQDTAIVPRFGSITVRTRFTDFVGGPVLMHCHILDHEDMGMMSRFEIAAL
jgi:FtsP/CotA-like multicopper oxidase with cupredoxin domain